LKHEIIASILMGGSKRSFPLPLCIYRSEDPYIEQEYFLNFKRGLMYNENNKVANKPGQQILERGFFDSFAIFPAFFIS